MSRRRLAFLSWIRRVLSRSRANCPSSAVAPAPAALSYVDSERGFHEQADEIARKVVAVVSRVAGNGYTPSHANRAVGPERPSHAASPTQDSEQTTTSTLTAVEESDDKNEAEKEQGTHAQGTWHGQLVGKKYDRREELTEEDEDMWARLAM